MSPTVTVIQTVVPDYRVGFYSELRKRFGTRLTVYSGAEYFQPTIKISPDISSYVRPIQNRFILKRRALIQSLPLHEVLEADVLVVELNPRILSTWLIALLRKFSRKPTVMWGHAWPRGGPDSPSDGVRKQMRGIADTLLVYAGRDKQMLLDRGYHKVPICVANNALYSQATMRVSNTARRTSFIYVGRLVAEKKPIVALRAFAQAASSLPEDFCLTIIGDGPETSTLITEAKQLGVTDRVHFHGHVSDQQDLETLYAQAVASLSPGYAGLSLTQSLGYGVPMLVSRDEPHAPEIEAAEEGQNCLFFETDNVSDLAAKMRMFVNDAHTWAARAEAISMTCRNTYSIEAMADGFEAAVLTAFGRYRREPAEQV